MVDEDVTFRLPVELRRELELAERAADVASLSAIVPATDRPPTLPAA